MHTTTGDMTALLYRRLLTAYGPLLRIQDIADVLRVSRAAVYLRRSRDRTDGMPPAICDRPLVWRTADIARWLAGEVAATGTPDATPASAPARRGRPRKVAYGE